MEEKIDPSVRVGRKLPSGGSFKYIYCALYYRIRD